MDRNIFIFLILASVFTQFLPAQDASPNPKATPVAAATTVASPDKPMALFGGPRGGESKGPTIITANSEATFESRADTASFSGNVQVQDPQFSLICDKLVVLLNKGQGGLKQADADGNVFIVSISKSKTGGADQKSTGKGEHATYTPGDGQIVLSGSPEIQQGGNTHIATDPSTRMYVFPDGRLHTTGPSRTLILNKSNSGPASSASPTPDSTPDSGNANPTPGQ